MSIFGDDQSAFDELAVTPLQRFAQFWVLVGRSFVRNRCPVRASALAYTTLLALVPMLAIVVSVSASLLKDKGSEPIQKVINTVIEKVAPQLDLVSADETDDAVDAAGVKVAGDHKGAREVAHKIFEFIGNIRTGTLSATAMIALVFIAISLLSTIEMTLNDIWGVTRGRNWVMRVVQYWAAITLGSIFIALAVGTTGGPYLKITQEFLARAPFLGSLLFQFLPIVILTATFAVFYSLLPNTAVHWKGALAGGLVAALLWQLNSSLNVLYLSQVVRSSKIYGSLGILPVFLIGLYFSWIIFLFGAQVSYSFQNRRAFFLERQAESVNQRGREFVGLRIMTFVAECFSRGLRPPTAQEIANRLAVPSRLVSKIVEPLRATQLLVEVAATSPTGAHAEMAYTPARPLETISCQNILDALRAGIGQELETHHDVQRAVVRGHFDDIENAQNQVAAHVTLAQIIEEQKAGALSPNSVS